ncbi:copper chaperone for superoxide dismutase-like [Dermacentor andersoni]|uniref:copper chaperone for superoxide dismutase-like n=1 Tax=Dermacentor andersoni TaxID=34620 RepID=UPI002154FDE9|nr:copper chaperone for superoxide dismutase-like [Dermacentor andersoni]
MATDSLTDGKSKLEFDVNMTCGGCGAKVRESLEKIGVRNMMIDVEKQSVVVETDIPFTKVQEAIKSTGKIAVLKGYGSSTAPSVAAAVSEVFGHSGIMGVVRFTQGTDGACIIDGVIDGLKQGQTHRLRIHELGDLSNGCESTGDVYDPHPITEDHKKPRRYGSLGEIDVDSNGRSVFRRTNDIVKVWDIIGRSLVVCSESSNKSHTKDEGCSRLACGIIARASGVAQNPKRICACDGVSVWDERTLPNVKKHEA